MNYLIYTKGIIIYLASFIAPQLLRNIPHVYKGMYFIFVCASVLLVFVYRPDIRHSRLKVEIVIKKQNQNTKHRTRRSFDLVKKC
jgi:hypothetical protein